MAQDYRTYDFAKGFKTVEAQTLIDYIENYHPEDKAAFKAAAVKEVSFVRQLKKGTKEYTRTQYVHTAAVRWFYGKYFPDYLPVAKETKPKKDIKSALADW